MPRDSTGGYLPAYSQIEPAYIARKWVFAPIKAALHANAGQFCSHGTHFRKMRTYTCINHFSSKNVYPVTSSTGPLGRVIFLWSLWKKPQHLLVFWIWWQRSSSRCLEWWWLSSSVWSWSCVSEASSLDCLVIIFEHVQHVQSSQCWCKRGLVSCLTGNSFLKGAPGKRLAGIN